MLEALIRDHPSDLSELISELPWISDAVAPLDLVASAEGAEVYLLTGGVRRLASDHWIRNKGLDHSAVRYVEADVITSLRLAGELY
jgi:hypothetical protein